MLPVMKIAMKSEVLRTCLISDNTVDLSIFRNLSPLTVSYALTHRIVCMVDIV